MPSTPLPMEMAHTQEDSSSAGRPPLSAAWNTITSGPA